MHALFGLFQSTCILEQSKEKMCLKDKNISNSLPFSIIVPLFHFCSWSCKKYDKEKIPGIIFMHMLTCHAVFFLVSADEGDRYPCISSLHETMTCMQRLRVLQLGKTVNGTNFSDRFRCSGSEFRWAVPFSFPFCPASRLSCGSCGHATLGASFTVRCPKDTFSYFLFVSTKNSCACMYTVSLHNCEVYEPFHTSSPLSLRDRFFFF